VIRSAFVTIGFRSCAGGTITLRSTVESGARYLTDARQAEQNGNDWKRKLIAVAEINVGGKKKNKRSEKNQ